MGAGWQVFRTIWSAPFQDDETMDAISRGEKVSMWTGKPLGRAQWARKREWERNTGRR